MLPATNHLGYDDYRARRQGRLETLDAVLADWKRELRAWLEGAQSWADALGLAAEPAVHHGWEENAGTILVASADRRLNALLSTRFRHIRAREQLDLFIDSAQTAAINALVNALTARNASEARRALDRFGRIDRAHEQRFHASTLTSALEAPTSAEPAQRRELLERMEREWSPTASTLRGARRRDFLAPLWRGDSPAGPRVPPRSCLRLNDRCGTPRSNRYIHDGPSSLVEGCNQASSRRSVSSA